MNKFKMLKLGVISIAYVTTSLNAQNEIASIEKESQERISFGRFPYTVSSKQAIINNYDAGRLKIVDIDEDFFLVIHRSGSTINHWEFLLYSNDASAEVWRLSGAAFSFEELTLKTQENEIELLDKEGRTHVKFSKIGKIFRGFESREERLERRERWRREMNPPIDPENSIDPEN